jgi:proline racemase
VLFWHGDGFSTACGHGTIALGAWAVHSGRVPAKPDGDTDVVLDVPSGRVTARVGCTDGVVRKVTFHNVGAYVLGRDVEVATARGTVRADLSYGGAIYASVPASSAGLAVVPEHYAELVALGREITRTLNTTAWASHPSDARLGGVYAAMLYDDLGRTDGHTGGGPHQRNLTVFADGQADRSPCGSGTSARLALLAADGRIADGEVFTHDSIVGTTFLGRVVGAGADGSLTTEVEGMAYRTGECEFVLDPADVLGTGFTLR